MRDWLVKARDNLCRWTEGFRALGVSLLLLLLDVADYFDVVPIQPILAPLFGEENARLIMLYAPVLIGTLRFVAAGNPRLKRGEQTTEEPF